MSEKSKSLGRFVRPRYWNAWLGYGALRLIALLPLPVIATLGYVLGELAYLLFGSRRHIARRNIDACFPELSKRERRKMLRRNFHVIGQGMLSTATVWWASASRLRRICRTRNEHVLKNALENNRKVILLVPHFVAVEIGGVFLSIDYPILDIYQRLRSELFDVVAYRQLTRFGGKMVEMREGLRTPIREVKTGTVLYYLPDQDTGLGNGAFVPFFGHPAATMTTLGRLAKITSAAIIPCYTRQLPWGRGYEIIFQSPLEDFPTDQGPEADARRMNEAIEAAVREIPEQYFWVHRRFKTRPEGTPPFYDK
jgi:KDO2-lipid IV(A) lauroyltransferase